MLDASLCDKIWDFQREIITYLLKFSNIYFISTQKTFINYLIKLDKDIDNAKF